MMKNSALLSFSHHATVGDYPKMGWTFSWFFENGKNLGWREQLYLVPVWFILKCRITRKNSGRYHSTARNCDIEL